MTAKKALIPTMGTRGDIQPYIALAEALDRAGIRTTIATHPCWRGLVEGYDLDFQPIGPDIDIELESAAIRGSSRHWLAGMLRTMKFMFRIIKEASPEVQALCRDMDLVIASHSHLGAAEAEAGGVPTVSVTLQPEVVPEKLKPVSRFEALLNQAVGAVVNPLMVRPYNGLRRELGLQPVKSFSELLSPLLNLIPVSPVVYPPKRYWEEKNRVTGYWFVKGEEAFQPPERLRDFLEAGDPPVIISLGAMGFESRGEKEKLELLINSIRKAKMRAVMQGFNRSLRDYQLPDSIISIGSVPHSWLFQHAYCVVHHGGFGTAAAVLKAGVPAVVIPHVLDQNLWAARVSALKAGTEPLKCKDLSEKALLDRLNTVKENYQDLRDNARHISQSIEQENGLQEAVSLIKSIL